MIFSSIHKQSLPYFCKRRVINLACTENYPSPYFENIVFSESTFRDRMRMWLENKKIK